METQEVLAETARSAHLAAWVLAALPVVVTAAWSLMEQTTRGPSLATVLMGVARTVAC